MASRLSLQSELEELLGTRNVYYQPPETLKIDYPAIIYEKSSIESKFANNQTYSMSRYYNITVVDKRSDNPVIEALLKLPYCSYVRHFVSDNLHHDIVKLYY